MIFQINSHNFSYFSFLEIPKPLVTKKNKVPKPFHIPNERVSPFGCLSLIITKFYFLTKYNIFPERKKRDFKNKIEYQEYNKHPRFHHPELMCQSYHTCLSFFFKRNIALQVKSNSPLSHKSKSYSSVHPQQEPIFMSLEYIFPVHFLKFYIDTPISQKYFNIHICHETVYIIQHCFVIYIDIWTQFTAFNNSIMFRQMSGPFIYRFLY